MAEDADLPLSVAQALANLGMVATRQGDYVQARQAFLEALSIESVRDRPRYMPRILIGLAEWAKRWIPCRERLIVLGKVDNLKETTDPDISGIPTRWYERQIQEMKDQVDDVEFQADFDAGIEMSLDCVIEVARTAMDARNPSELSAK